MSEYKSDIVNLDEWRKLMSSGTVSYVRPREMMRGRWWLHAYNRYLAIPLLASIPDSEEAHKAVIDNHVSIEEPKGRYA